jgi:hypothetical protein
VPPLSSVRAGPALSLSLSLSLSHSHQGGCTPLYGAVPLSLSLSRSLSRALSLSHSLGLPRARSLSLALSLAFSLSLSLSRSLTHSLALSAGGVHADLRRRADRKGRRRPGANPYNPAHIRQPRPDSGLGFQIEVLNTI